METLNSANFESTVKNSSTPIVVDFFAEWCGPCKMLSPVLESLVPEYEGKLEIAKVDIDQSSDIARQFSVSSVPTLIVFKDGQEVDRLIGFQSKDSLNDKFNSLI